MTTSRGLKAIVLRRNARLAKQSKPPVRRLPANALYGQLGTASPELVKIVERAVNS